MSRIKKITRYIGSSWFLAIMLYLYVIFCYRTSKVTWKNKNGRDELETSGESFCYLLWHNRVALCPYLASKKRISNVHAVVSRHGDGEILSKLLKLFSIKLIRGSSDNYKGAVRDRGGSKAIKEIRKAVKAGANIAITPDGPRGPKYQIKDNLIPIASVTGMRLACFNYEISRAWKLNSWDEMLVPKPFSKIEFELGKVFDIPRKMSAEDSKALHDKVEEELVRLTTSSTK